MTSPRSAETLVAAARLYYLHGRSQAAIAAQLGTSRSNVSRMLTEAQRQGIVEIKINDPSGRVHELEDELRSLFGLREVRVARAGAVPGLKVEDEVGRQAARLLLDHLKDDMTVALSWGRALQSMVFAVTAEQEHHRLRLVQLVGGLSSISNEISGQELVRELAVRLGAEYRFLHAPATLESGASRNALLAEPSIAEALEEAGRADLAFVGIGTPAHGSSAAIVDAVGLSPEEKKAFWDAKPAGDVAARYFNADGQPLLGPIDERVLGISLDALLDIPDVVGVATGRAKTPGVLGALRGRLIDSLVCDESLARALITQPHISSSRSAGEPGGL